MNGRLLEECVETMREEGKSLTFGGGNGILGGMKDNLDKTDNELLGERVEQIVLNETSRLQKAKRRFLHPAHNHIRSICIITSQNPFGVKAPRKENDALAKDLEMRLRVEKFPFYPVRGKYGSVERSYMIFNIGLDDAKLIGHRYDQQSFIYIVVDETGGMEFQLWWKDKESTLTDDEKKEGKNPESYRWKDMQERGWFGNGANPPARADYRYIESKTRYLPRDPADPTAYTQICKDMSIFIPFDFFKDATSEFNQSIQERCETIPGYERGVDRNIQSGMDSSLTKNTKKMNRWTVVGEADESLLNYWKGLA